MKEAKELNRFIEMRASGKSFEAISNDLGIPAQTLVNWSKECAGEISNMKAMKLEAIQEKYRLTREGRIQFLGDVMEKLRGEIARRDLSSIETDKLFHLVHKFLAMIKEESIQPTFKDGSEIRSNKSIYRLIKSL
jgi:hypothetical protein